MVGKMPVEVLEHLFLYVDDPSDLFNLRIICKQWHSIITNERFLNIYFRKRFGVQSRRTLQWIITDRWALSPFPDYSAQYPAPTHLRGSGGVVLHSASNIGKAAFPLDTFTLNNHDYSIAMWLRISSRVKHIRFNMKFDDFSLEFTLYRTYVQVRRSHAGGLQAEARIKVPVERWFHIVLTYSSKFQFYINGCIHPFICTEGPLNENQMFDYIMEYIGNNGHLVLLYEDDYKFGSMCRFADIQILPCALTQCEINAIVKKTTCINELNMGKYLLDHWDRIHSYWKYLPGCTLF